MTGRVSNGKINVLFKEWIVVHSKAEIAMTYLDELREARRESRSDTEATGASLFAASHCGKSHIVNKMYFSRVILPELRREGGDFEDKDIPDEDVKKLQRKLVYVRVPPKPNLGDFGAELLKALYDPFPRRRLVKKPRDDALPRRRETVLERINRAVDIMNDPDDLVELLALDDFEQLTKKSDSKTMREASEVQDIMKTIMEKGIPIVFIGLYNAKMALNNMQLKNRVCELDIMPFRFERDFEKFCEYIAGLELLMLDRRIFDQPSGLYEERVALRLYYASQGRIGVLSNIIRNAAKLASTLKRPRIEQIHLEIAVANYTVKDGICEFNPFLVRSDKVVAKACKVRVAADEKHYDDDYKKYFR